MMTIYKTFILVITLGLCTQWSIGVVTPQAINDPEKFSLLSEDVPGEEALFLVHPDDFIRYYYQKIPLGSVQGSDSVFYRAKYYGLKSKTPPLIDLLQKLQEVGISSLKTEVLTNTQGHRGLRIWLDTGQDNASSWLTVWEIQDDQPFKWTVIDYGLCMPKGVV